MVQVAEYLPSKHKTQIQTPAPAKKKKKRQHRLTFIVISQMYPSLQRDSEMRVKVY
jgi:hypothetical protein